MINAKKKKGRRRRRRSKRREVKESKSSLTKSTFLPSAESKLKKNE
jgi:hypothetical protein